MDHEAVSLLPIETRLLDYDELLDAFFRLLRLIFPNIPFGKAELRFKAYRVNATKNALPDALSDLSTVLLRDYVAMYYSSAAHLTDQAIYRLFDRFSVDWIFSPVSEDAEQHIQLVAGFTRLYAAYKALKPALERHEYFLSTRHEHGRESLSASESESDYTDSDYETTLDAEGFPEYFPTLKQKQSASSSTATTRPPRYQYYSQHDGTHDVGAISDAVLGAARQKTWRALYPEACRAMGMKGYGYIVRMLLYGPQRPVTGKTMTLFVRNEEEGASSSSESLYSSSSSFSSREGGGRRRKLVVPAWPFKQHHLSLSYRNIGTFGSHVDAGGVLTYCKIVNGDCRAEVYYHRIASRQRCALRMLREPFMVRFADRQIGVISTEPFYPLDMTAAEVPKVVALLERLKEIKMVHHNVSLSTLVRTLEGEPRLIHFNHAWYGHPYHWLPEKGDWEDRSNTTYKGWTGVVPDQPSYDFDSACLVASVLHTVERADHGLFDACYRLLVDPSGGVINVGADGVFFRTGGAVPRRLSTLSGAALAWLKNRRRR